MIRVGNLDARRDFLDVRDVVEAYLLAATAPSLPRGVVLISPRASRVASATSWTRCCA